MYGDIDVTCFTIQAPKDNYLCFAIKLAKLKEIN